MTAADETGPASGGARAPAGLVERLASTWRDPRAAVRREVDTAGELRLLGYAVAASAIAALGAAGASALAPPPETGVAGDPALRGGAQAMLSVALRPVGLYGAAALLGLLARAFGGRGGWRATRAAAFWTDLAVAPVALALALVAALFAGLTGFGAVAGLGAGVGSILWAALLAPALAEAHGGKPLSFGAAVVGTLALLALLTVGVLASA